VIQSSLRARATALAALALVPALAGAAAGCGPRTAKNASDASDFSGLRVSRVVLYTNGIGYFERSGTLTGEALTLRIRADQINDFLKSLTIVDRSGGSAVSVSLPIERDAAISMSELPPAVRDAGGLVKVLESVRGARVKVVAALFDPPRTVTATGRVVGIDASSGVARVTVLDDAGKMIAVPVDAITDLVLLDKTLEIGLRKGLDMALGEGSWKPVELTIRLKGKKSHDLTLGYVIEMPVWKPAYRLVVGAEGEPALLQGWAVVDNTSGETWDRVKLSLAAGTPMSFLYDLHAPRIVGRPDLTPSDEVAMAPPEATGYAGAPPPPPAPVPLSVASGDDKPDKTKSKDSKKIAPPPKKPAGKGSGKKDEADDDGYGAVDEESVAMDVPAMTIDALSAAMSPLVTSTSVAGLLTYDLGSPVTVPDRSSSLVSIIDERVPGEDVYLYQPDAGSALARTHPFRAARFVNGTPFVLEKGPIAIYAGGTFVGEGILARIAAGSETFVPYALDTRVSVEASNASGEESVVLAKIVKGIFTVESYMYRETKYRIENRTEHGATMYLRHRKTAGWDLKDRPDGTKEEGGIYLVPVKMGASGPTEIVLKERTPYVRTIEIFDSMVPDLLRAYIKKGDADPVVAKKLDELLAARARLGTIDEERTAVAKLLSDLHTRAEELRDNLDALKKTAAAGALRADLMKKLKSTDDLVDERTKKMVALDEGAAEARIRLSEILAELTLEPKKAPESKPK